MTDLLIIRLHPGQQVDPNEFRKWLHGLEISAYDLTFTDNAAVVQLGASQGVLLGKTSGLAQVPPDGSNKIGVHPNTHPVPVMQHYIDYTAGLVTKHALQSAATVAIKAVPPAGHPEYPKPTSYDLRLVITRNGVAITDDELDFNVAVASRAPLPDDQTWYFQQAAATYVTLPPVSSGKLALDLSPNGPPPAFGALVTAIDKVLADDPGGGAKLATHAPLTLGQCQQIASEIIWDRSYYPPPAQPTGDGSADNGYGSLYTNPNPNGPDPSKTDPTRQKFEGQWASYNATTDALAIRLAGYVYAASAAVQCELSSTKATTAAFPFPLVTGQGTPVDTEVELETIPAGASFAVPAAYFYALATQLSPQITADQRYKLATLAPEDNTLKQMTDAATAGTVTAGVTIEGVAQAPEGFLTDSTLTAINISQAARRLAALGTVSGSLPAVTADAHVTELVKAWLGYKDETAKIDTGFWQGEVGAAATAAHQADYLVLVLQVVTGEAAGSAEFTAFLAAIQAAPLSVTNVAELAGLTDQQWQTFFVADPALLPAFTPKGSTLERTAAFIGHLQQFFTTPIGSVTPVLQSPNEPYSLGPPPGDVLTLFAQNYSAEGGGTFKFGTAWDQTALGAAVNDTFPHDHQGQAWLHDALTTIEALYDLTAFAASDAKTSELRFSLIEALYARGFTSAAQVAALTASDFTAALAGSVAYPYATQIQTAAGGPAAPPGSAGSDFKPVNPDRSLTNCVPPEHLSPLGPVAYLSELLSASAASTCEEPKDTDTSQQIGTLLTSRRGPLGDLLATRANLQTPLPAIDLVNESLEALAAAVAAGGTPAGGAVFDTSATSLADLRLRAHGEDEEHECGCGTQPGGLDPAEAFAAIAEHSSPAARHCPPAETAAYAALRTDFTAPRLPYDQPLDVCRSYLCQLETSRFEAMRRFRKDITEFVLDPAPADEPAGFARHLWRYPVRFDLALEYLGISTEEYSLLYSQPLAAQAGEGQLTLWQAYGFPAAQAGEASWTTVVTGLPEFLRRTGLSYCELAELQRSGFVQFTVQATAARQPPGTDTATTATPGAQDTPPADVAPGRLPECEPCCLADWTITFPGATTDTAGAAQTRDPQTPLYELLVFIRLWRRLRERAWCDLTFTELAAVAKALGLFGGTPSSPVVNPDFLRQFAALLILRDDLRVSPLLLLPLWAAPSPADQRKAVALLLAGVERHARAWYRCPAREPEFVKVATSNLDPLSVLAGFDPDTASDTWQALPTHTLRFAEVLGKVYASNFTVGEVLFLFTALPHLDGDDPFPLPDANEATDDPLALPEADPSAGDGPHSLWALRHALLETEVGEEDAREWGWARIAATLREEFGYDPAPGDPSPLTELGEHFFPSVLERHGLTLSPHAREFRTQLHPNDTTAAMWDAEASPFRYDQAAGELYARLPLRDSAVIARLRDLRQLNDAEKTAVQDLYFAPRTLLAQFSMVFGNFGEAVDFLVHAEDDDERFAFFQGEFARFHARCQVVARHLTHHVAAALGHGDNSNRRPSAAAAWRVLRSLLADGNWGSTPWEDDSGQPPGVTLWPAPMGSAFAALLGLAGTGLLGEYRTAGTDPAWRELRGPLTAFGEEQDEHNCPVPTVLPPLGLTLTSQQLRLAAVRNGFAMRDSDGEPLGGAAPFSVRWSGVLLVERPGEYRFHAGAPGEDGPDFDAAQDNRWRVVLQRGQRTWEVLSHGHDEDAPSARSEPLRLRRGAYQVTVEFTQREPVFARAEDVCPVRTGFEVAYTGPDTDDQLTPVPAHRLFRPFTGTTLADGIAGVWPVAEQFLARHYAPDLRDIRRTYQRAFKGLLLAERFRLSADPLARYHQSELGYFLDNPTQFEGTSYYRTGPQQFGTHHAWFALDLLPVTDPCPPPLSPPGPPTDQRGYPSPQRQAALFDWWERLFDYCWLREQTERARERPAWLLFDEAAQDQPDDPAELLRHLDVDLRFAPLVSTYFDTPEYPLSPADLADERWAVRVWHGAVWLRRLVEFFAPASIGTARPDLWASDDPGAAAGAPPVSGNANLTHFVQEGCFGDGRPHRAGEVRDLGNGLRERARDALVAYLCGMDRVLLPWPKGQYATGPADLSGLLLQDVATGICTRMSRVEDAVRAVHAFVQRARLGMEPSFPVTPGFARVWEKRFASLRLWQACRRREVYLENWVEWDDLRVARKVEAFRFLEEQLRRSVLSVAVPGGDSWWPGWRPPQHPTLDLLQDREPAALVPVPTGATAEGLGLLAAQQRAASPAWLAPVLNAAATQTASDQDTGGSAATADLPLWLQTAIGLGTQFVRVAAGSLPPACTHVTPGEPGSARGCCAECEKASPPVVDEYYFWLGDAHYFLDTDAAQDADATAKGSTLPADASSGWEDPGQLPGMLAWNPAPMVHLYWSRLRDGEFTPPRRSSEGLPVTDPPPSGQPQLVPAGRTGDTLRFTVPNGSVPVGYTVPAGPVPYDSADPGFRYDLADDAAVPLPLVAPIAPAPTAPDYFGLPAFPYFAYVSPGAPVEPLSPACVATTVAGPLRAHCQFETALKWYELAYSPMTSDNTWAQCGTREGGGGTTTVGTADGGVVVVGGSTGVTEPGADAGGGVAVVGGSTGTTRTGGTPGGGVAVVGGGTGVTEVGGGDLPCCPSAPVPAPVARDRAVLLAYLETLLHWGDATACRESPEAAQQAKVTFETLARVLGPAPVTVFARDDTGTPMNLTGFKPRPASLNPRLLSLYERCADRLALVSDCLDGRRLRPATPHDDPLFWGDNPLRDGWRDVHGPCDGDPCQAGLCHEDDGLCCCGPYRFSFWVRYAMELTAEVRSLGAELLAAYEKGDAEVLAALRATHERQLADLVLAARQYTWREADWQVQALELTKQGAQARLQYYQQLLAAGLIAGETAYQALTGVAIDDHSSANMSEAIGQVMEYIPDIAFGVAGMGPYLSNQIPIGTKLGGTFQTVARIINTEAEMASTNGGLNLTQASWVRRTAEWQLQVQTITIEIAQIQRQILAAQRHRDAALRDLNVAQRQIEHSAEVQDFLRDKFTNGDLYLYLQQHTAGLYRQTYDLALHAGRRAQRAYNRERGHTARRFLPDPGWDNLHEGLLAGERLQLALRQMETSYTDLNCREYELTKHLSLRLDFPLAYLHLRHRGWAEIEVPEWLFDLDYPGQFLRRIKNVTLTIPCVVGPYTGVHAKLTLLGSSTRVDPRLAGPAGRCCGERRGHGCGCGGPCRCREECGRCGCGHEEPPGGYLALPGDPRIVREYAATEAIATSSGQNDSGMFELSFRDERYLPFEFAGAVSRWRIELPPENNFFDLDTVTDVVLHLNYTAREGGEALRRAASEQAQQHLPGGGVRLFDVRHDLPDAWARLTHPAPARRDPDRCDPDREPGGRDARLVLRLGREHFPYLPCGRDIQVCQLGLYVAVRDPDCHASLSARFVAEHDSGHGPDEECQCEGTQVECMVTPGCPVLYHGVLDREFPVLRRGEPCDLGELVFDLPAGQVADVFVVCGYRATCR